MKLEDLLREWENDSKIDKTELGEESLKTPQLHHKYYKYLLTERSEVRKMKTDLAQLRLELEEFFLQGPSKETQARGWKLPAQGRILRQDIPRYVDTHPDHVDIALMIGLQNEKIDLIDSVLKCLANRRWDVRNAIDWAKMMLGN